MVRLTVKYLLSCLVTLALVMGGLLAGLIVRLQYGPLSLEPIQEMIVQNLQDRLPEKWQISWLTNELIWDEQRTNIVVKLADVKVVDENLQPVIQVGEVKLITHILRLIQGRWVPRDISLQDAHIALQVKADDLKGADDPQPATAQNMPLMATLNTKMSNIWRDLRHVQLESADMLLTLGNLPPLAFREITLDARREKGHVLTRFNATRFIYETQQQNDFRLIYDFDWKEKLSDITLQIDNTHLSEFLPYFSQIDFLPDIFRKSDWQLPLSLTLKGSEIKQSDTQKKMSWGFSLQGGEGFIGIPDYLPHALAVEQCNLKGELSPAVQIQVQNCQFRTQHGLMNLALNAQQQGQQWHVQSQLQNIPLADIEYIWPPSVAPGGFIWLNDNMQSGLIPKANLEVVYDPQAPNEIARLHGDIEMQNVTSKFLKPLPPAENISGTAVIDQDQMIFDLKGGHYQDQKIENTKLEMSDLFGDLPKIKITTVFNGPLSTALRSINQEPYHLLKSYTWIKDINFKKLQGDHHSTLIMQLPMLAAVKIKDILYDVKGTAENISWLDFYRQLPLRANQADFQLTPELLSIKGEIGIGTAMARLDWQQQIKADTQQGKASGKITAMQLDNLGIPVKNYMTGTASWQATLAQKAKSPLEIMLNADFKNSGLKIAETGYVKPPGQAVDLSMTLLAQNGRMNIQGIKLSGPELKVEGQLQLNEDNSLAQLKLNPLKIGRRTDGQLELTNNANHQRWEFRGSQLDPRPFLKNQDRQKTGQQHPAQQIHAQASRLWLSDDLPIEQANIQLVRPADYPWQLILIKGQVGQNADPLSVTLQNGKFNINMRNAGQGLHALDASDHVVGGTLTAEGRATAGRQLKIAAQVSMKNFRIRQAPLLARILSVTSPTGLLDLLNQQGLRFDELKSDVEYTDTEITLHQGKLNSDALGLTFNGIVDTDNHTLNLKGTMVPLYMFNRLISKIPLIGDVLGGSDEAVLGASYSATGDIDDPKVVVNPLSALTPGFLRDLLFNSDVPDREK